MIWLKYLSLSLFQAIGAGVGRGVKADYATVYASSSLSMYVIKKEMEDIFTTSDSSPLLFFPHTAKMIVCCRRWSLLLLELVRSPSPLVTLKFTRRSSQPVLRRTCDPIGECLVRKKRQESFWFFVAVLIFLPFFFCRIQLGAFSLLDRDGSSLWIFVLQERPYNPNWCLCSYQVRKK